MLWQKMYGCSVDLGEWVRARSNEERIDATSPEMRTNFRCLIGDRVRGHRYRGPGRHTHGGPSASNQPRLDATKAVKISNCSGLIGGRVRVHRCRGPVRHGQIANAADKSDELHRKRRKDPRITDI